MASPGFLNVDLEIRSAAKLELIAAELGKRVLVLYSGREGKRRRYLLALENSRDYKSPDTAIHALCSEIEKLSPTTRRVWKAAQKMFDVGYELRPAERLSRFTLRSDTLKRISSLGAILAITYYRPEFVEELTVGVSGEK